MEALPLPIPTLTALGAALLLSLLLTPLVRALAIRAGWFGSAIPPLGGLSIVTSTVVGYGFVRDLVFPGLMEGAVGMALVGLADDIHRFRPRTKMLWQTGVACFVVWAGLVAPLSGIYSVDAVLTVAWIVWMCNAYNVLDMEDGLSAGVGVVICLATTVLVAGNATSLPLGPIVGCLGGLLGYLVYNFHPARVYMGDTGSLFLGFFFAALGIQMVRLAGGGAEAVVGPVLLLIVPNFEAVFVAATRIAKTRSPVRVSRDHVAQRLVASGRSVRGAVVRLYLFAAVCGGSAILWGVAETDWRWAIPVAAILGCAALWRALQKVDMEGDGLDGRPSSVFAKNWLVLRLTHRAIAARAHLGSCRLLDLGCGLRPYAPLFRAHVDTQIGVDRKSDSAADVSADLGWLPLRSACADAVLCSQVLEHVPEPAYFVGEMSRILRPNGVVILTAPHIWGIHEEPHDYFRFTHFGLRSMAERAGLTVESVDALAGFWVTAGARFCYYLERFERGPLALIVRMGYVVVQTGAFLLDQAHRVDSDAWNYAMVARKPPDDETRA